jgi:hypothetical protein
MSSSGKLMEMAPSPPRDEKAVEYVPERMRLNITYQYLNADNHTVWN